MISINGNKMETKFFPDGTPCILNLPEVKPINNEIEVYWQYNSKEFAHIMFILAHYSHRYSDKIKIIFTCYYLPNARMDRTKSEYECFTLKYFIEMVSQYANVIVTTDLHSKISVDFAKDHGVYLFEDNAIVSYYVRCAYKKFHCNFICYPDKGAYDRYWVTLSDIQNQLYCEKKRDWETGKIESVEIAKMPLVDYKNWSVLIVDDICSYGGTIDRCAAKLKEVGFGKVYAYVTHCENSVFDGKLLRKDSNIEGIFTTNSIEHDEEKKKDIDKIFYEAIL